jgi:2-keto-4-pentenoate hydratase/2-oxohepta-3-ene-1,7-dioic acid hydratase in catechol pathway
MRLATIVDAGRLAVVAVRDGRVVSLETGDSGLGSSVRAIVASGADGQRRIEAWLAGQSGEAGQSLHEVVLGPAVPDPGAIYAVGLNYRAPDEPAGAGPERPLVYGKAPNSAGAHGDTLSWDRSVTATVDAEVELGVVIGRPAWRVTAEDAMRHVFGYTVVNDVSSRDPWLDGDQWLIGKSMPGFCPVGPWIVTRDELDAGDLRLGCTINGVAIQNGRTSQMRFSIPEVIAYLSRHVRLEAGDLIATGTPARLTTPPGPERHLEAGDVVTVWIDRIGELTTIIA